MKKVLCMTASILFLTGGTGAPVHSAPNSSQGATVIVTVHGLASSKGRVLISLCTKSEFLRRCKLSRMVPAKRGDVSAPFRNVPPNIYAVMAYHDENGNGHMDRTSIGIPAEGYGFSRDAMGEQSAPSFDSAAVRVSSQKSRIEIDMRY